MLATRLKGASSAGGLIYVGGYVTQFAGTTSTTSVTLTSLTGGIASAPAAGDLVIVGYGISSTTNVDVTISTAGYTEVYDLYEDDTYDANLGVFYKTMSGTPDTSVVVGQTGSTSNAGAVYISVWRNENSTWPLRSVASAQNINSILANPPSITATGSSNAVVAIGVGALNTISANYSSSDLTDFQSTRQADTNSVVIGGGYKNPVSGTFDPAAFTGPTTSTSASWVAASLEIREQNQNTPSFVSVSNTRAGDNSVIVTAPSGIQNGDLLIAVAYLSATAETITLPSGFTSVEYDTTAAPLLRVGYKIASNESGNYTFSYSIDRDSQSTILVYRNSTYNIESIITRVDTQTPTANALTNPNVGINLYLFTNDIGNTTVNTGPTGGTQRLLSLGGSAFDIALAIYDENATAPISTNKTLTWSQASNSVATGLQINIAG